MVSVGGSKASDGFGGSKAHGREEFSVNISVYFLSTMNNNINAENKQERRSMGRKRPSINSFRGLWVPALALKEKKSSPQVVHRNFGRSAEGKTKWVIENACTTFSISVVEIFKDSTSMA